jgi:hypothetical protein
MTVPAFALSLCKCFSAHRAIAALCSLLAAVSSGATTLLEDTFADGTRNNQNLPTDAAWYVSSSSSWTTTVGSMSVAMGSAAILGVSYFGANSSSPISLAVGDQLTATIKFTFTGVTAGNTSGGFRIGLFDFADSTLSPKWATADLSSNSGQGNGVQGYALFQTMGIGNAAPMDIRKRTTTSDSSLLGSSGDYTSLGSGALMTNWFNGFVAGPQYRLQLSFMRTNSTTLVIAAIWQNVTNGASIAWSVTDTNATGFNFDGIGFRPSSAASSATNIVFNEVKVELVSAGASPAISISPADVAAYTGQSAFFSVVSDGSAPLSYQWYFNTNTPLNGATNASLTLTNLQLTNSGSYAVIVTNL